MFFLHLSIPLYDEEQVLPFKMKNENILIFTELDF